MLLPRLQMFRLSYPNGLDLSLKGLLVVTLLSTLLFSQRALRGEHQFASHSWCCSAIKEVDCCREAADQVAVALAEDFVTFRREGVAATEASEDKGCTPLCRVPSQHLQLRRRGRRFLRSHVTSDDSASASVMFPSGEPAAAEEFWRTFGFLCIYKYIYIYIYIYVYGFFF